MNRPNFLLLGAAKGGTTSLYYFLKQHPDVCMSKPKETHFFGSVEYDEGLGAYWARYFRGWHGQRAVGEATPNYLFVPFIAEQIRRDLPDAKLIAILRHPAERAYSHWWMNFSRGEESLSFEEAVENNRRRVAAGLGLDGPHGEELWKFRAERRKNGQQLRFYLDRGYYAQQLNRYLALFPSSQLKVVFFEDLCCDPQSVVRELWAFLGVDSDQSLTDATQYNTALNNRALGRLVGALASLGVNRVVPDPIKTRLGGTLSKIGKKPAMGGRIRALLIQHYFTHNRELEALTGRDLSHWDR